MLHIVVYWFNGLIFTKGLVLYEVIGTNDVHCGVKIQLCNI